MCEIKTREQFLADMIKGWKTLRYTSGPFYRNGQIVLSSLGVWQQEEIPTSACAIGAAAFAVGMWANDYMNLLPGVCCDIAGVSDAAGSKRAAIKAIKALEWWNPD